MGRCLIVANQTLGGPSLDDAIRERIQRGDTFFIVVPTTPPEHEVTAWTFGFPMGGEMVPYATTDIFEEDLRQRRIAEKEARQRAERRLDTMLDKVRSVGGMADGAVGDADPIEAVRAVLDDREFDEVVVSTLPAGLSRWLKMDLPSRLSRMTDIPVVTVEAPAVDNDGAGQS